MKLRATILYLYFSISLTAQINQRKAFQFALEGGATGKEFIFQGNLKNQCDSLVLVYLGEIKVEDGRIVKVLTSRWFWGPSKRATSRIIVFNSKNQYLGDYYLTKTSDIPDKIDGDALVFIKMEENICDPKITSRISFKKGIPKSFFLRCNGNLGTNYSFEQNL